MDDPLAEDASDVKIAATYIKHSDYVQLSALIAASNTSHSGLRTLSLLITADYSTWEWYSYVVSIRLTAFSHSPSVLLSPLLSSFYFPQLLRS